VKRIKLRSPERRRHHLAETDEDEAEDREVPVAVSRPAVPGSDAPRATTQQAVGTNFALVPILPLELKVAGFKTIGLSGSTR
jgi:hypothetical protein